MPNSSNHLRPGPLRSCWPVIAVVLCGVTFSAVLFGAIRGWERRAMQTALQTTASQRLELLRETLGNSMEALHSLRAFYDANGVVTRTEFQNYVKEALDRRPELLALSWDPRVPAAERARYEAAARADGFADFEFTEHDPTTGRMIRARVQPEYYYPVYFIEPLERNRAAFGFDLNARGETLARACDTGDAVATPPTRLIQVDQDEPGFIVFVPLFPGPPPTTVAERRAQNTGFVAAVFRLPNLVAPALARLPGIRATVSDVAVGGPAADFTAPAADAAPDTDRLEPCALTLPVAGREWRITFTPTTTFLAAHRTWQSWAVLITGLLATGLLAAYLLADLRHDELIARGHAALQLEVVERQRAEQAAAAANRAKSDFLAGLSHEIRTPLNAILGYTQILDRDPDFPHRHRDAVGALTNSGHHLLGLLNSILDLSKIEAGRMEVQRDVFDVPALVRGLAEMFKPRCAEKRLTLRLAGPVGGAVVGDEGKLRQVLINLLGNAIKFTPRGEVLVAVRPAEGDRWLFEVVDTGPGISTEEQRGLFTPFHQTAAGRRHGGTGLGLAIAHGQVALMGGKLEVQSETGTGTRFHFTLPLPAARTAPAAAAPLLRLAPDVVVRALVVDDNRDNCIILARLLADLGCRVVSASTVERAHDIVRQAPPDIIFLDVLLDGTTGPALLTALQADGLPAATPVLYHTAAMLERTQREALRADGADLLAKPFRIEDLGACLRRVPGVRFEDALRDAPEAPPPAELEQVLLPEELCTRMSVAAELHSTTVLKACFEELRQLGGPAEPLANHLRHLLRAYDLAEISRLVGRLRVQPAPSHAP